MNLEDIVSTTPFIDTGLMEERERWKEKEREREN